MAEPYDERLEHLLAIAAQEFARKGYHPTTMRGLALATGMSLAGMYHYVRGKDELLFLIQRRCFERVITGAEAAVDAGTGPRDRLERFVHHHVTFFARHKNEMKVLSHEAESLRGAPLAEINALKRRYVELLFGIIAAVEGDVRLDGRLAAYALFGMMNWIYNWYDPAGPVPPEQLADQFARLFLDGLTAPSPFSVPQGD